MLEVGGIFARVGARFDGSDFDRWERRVRESERMAARGATAHLGAHVDGSGFSRYSRELDRTETHHRGVTGRMRASMAGLSTGIVGSVGVATAGFALLGAGALRTFSDFEESAKVGRQTEAVIRSTGGAAKVSAKEVGDFATAMSRKTGIDDEAIQSGENLLLTFTNVRNEAGKGNDIFTQSSKVLLDLSSAMGTEPKAAAVQLGKALNDPVKGITALTRVGVTFTDKQKKTIKTLTESNDRLGAQKIILGELRKEFGGSAEANATAGAKLKVALGNLSESIGGALEPALSKGADALTGFLNDLQDGTGSAGRFGRKVKAAAREAGDALQGARRVASSVFRAIGDFVDDNRGKLGDLASGARRYIGNVVSAFKRVADAASDVFGKGGIGADISKIASTLISFASTVLNKVVNPIVERALPGIESAFRGFFTVIRGVVRLISGVLTGDFGKAWEGVKDIFGGAVKAIGGIIRAGTAPIRAAASAVGKAVGSALSAGWHQAQVGARKFVNSIIDVINLIPGVEIKHVNWGSDSGGSSSKATAHRGGGRGEGSPAAVSSGELIRHPDGSWSVVPGQPTAADNVLTWLEHGAEVYTWDGQAKLASGMSREQTLATQLPHFGLGGVLKTAANVVTAPARGAASLLGKGVDWFLDKLPAVPEGMLSGAMGWAKDKAVDWIKDKVSSLGGDGGAVSSNGLVEQVVRAIAWARSHGWRGQVTSGFRDPAHQIAAATAFAASLGKTVAEVYPNGPLASSHVNGQAVDVTDPAGFARALANAPADSRLYNRIPWDPVHYSVTGYGDGGRHDTRNKKRAGRRRRYDPVRQYEEALAAAKSIGQLEDFDPVAAVRATDPAKAKKKADGKGSSKAPAGLMEQWTKTYHRFISSSPVKGEPVLSSESVTKLAQYVGLPGRTFDLIAKGESGRAPGIQQPDPGDGMVGYGLWQNTPNAWGAGSSAMRYFRSLGGIPAMFEPLKNARMAKYLYDHAASKTPGKPGFPWYGTQYLRLGGLVQAFRNGGRSSKGTGLVKNGGVMRSVARAEKGIAKYEDTIQRLEKDYDLTDAEYGVRPLELVTEHDDGSVERNEAAISARVTQLQTLRRKREAIRAKIEEYRAKILEAMATIRAAIARLRDAIKATRGGSRAKVRQGYQDQIDKFEERLGELEGTYTDLGEDLRQNAIDLDTIDVEIEKVKGTESKAADPTGDTPTGDTPTDIATAALAQLSTFQSARSDVFGNFGANFVRTPTAPNSGPILNTPDAQAAGTRYFGGSSSGSDGGVLAGAGGVLAGAGGGITQNIYMTGPQPADPHVFVQTTLHELTNAV